MRCALASRAPETTAPVRTIISCSAVAARVAVVQPSQELLDPSGHPAADLAGVHPGRVGAGELRRGVDERAAAPHGPEVVAGQGGGQLVERRRGSSGCAAMIPSTWSWSYCARRLEVGRDQVVLGREVAVERDPGDLGLRDDALDPDRVDALVVEQPVGGRQDPLPRLRRTSARSPCRLRCWIGHRLLLRVRSVPLLPGPARWPRLATRWVDRSVYPRFLGGNPP